MNRTRTFRAPGRVNLIGEHTDYNLGFVLPIALDLATYIETSPSEDRRLRIYSEQHREERIFAVGEIGKLTRQKHWSDYVIGVAQQLMAHGLTIEPLSLRIRSNVPEGSGLSSSAALEVSTAFALLQGRSFDKLEIVRLCRRAETDFVGMPCGIMDQYVSVFGRDHAAICIDCRSLEHKTVRIPENVEIIAVNSMVKHELGASAYSTRVQECEAAVQAIRGRFPHVESLRDANPAEVEKTPMPRTVMRRARHVVTENTRVELFVHAAELGNLNRMGELFTESHRSMQHDYEITCDEVDFLVDTAIGLHGCYGARMTGGGFGGCTVNLVDPGAVERFVQSVRERYRERFQIDPAIFRCIPAAGAGEVVPGRGHRPERSSVLSSDAQEK